MKIIDYIEDSLPTYVLSYLFNGDASGIETEDEQNADGWLSGLTERLQSQYPGCDIELLIDDADEGSFCRFPAFGLASDCVACVVAVFAENEHPAPRIALPWEEDEEETAESDEIDPSAFYWASFNRLRVCMPGEAVLDIAKPGPADDAVKFWQDDAEFLAWDPTAMEWTADKLKISEAIRAELKEYGAWDAEELSDDEQNISRIAWIAAGNISEDETPERAEALTISAR